MDNNTILAGAIIAAYYLLCTIAFYLYNKTGKS